MTPSEIAESTEPRVITSLPSIDEQIKSANDRFYLSLYEEIKKFVGGASEVGDQ